jgi:stalled ribosome rescue protein Dom34
MAIRIKTKWHRSKRSGSRERGPRTPADLAGVIAFNLWKIAQEAFRRMEKEGFRFREDTQVITLITEFIAYLSHVVDRMLYGRLDDTQRAEFMNALVKQLAHTMVENQRDLLGPGDYREPFIATINARFDQYAECGYDADAGPSYEMTRGLAQKVAEAMQVTDDRWVLEQIMDIEAPEAVKMLRRLVRDVVGL